MKYRTEYDLKVIGKNLKRLREKHQMTVEQLREYLCLGSVQAIYKYEAGVGYPQADTLLALMELYGVGVNDIVKCQEGELSSPSCAFRDIFTKKSKKVKLNVVFPNKSLVYK